MLTIHKDKTKYMIFGSKQKLKNLKEMHIMIGNDKIKQAVKSKYLGVWFDQHLSWNEHFQIVADKINMRIGKIKRAIPFLSRSTRKLLVNTLVMPHFDCCSEVWSSAS